MRSAIIGLGALLSGCMAQPPAATTTAIPEIAGRVAGTPQRCVRIDQNQGLRIANAYTLVYGSGRTVWVNRLAEECSGFKYTDILVVEPIGSQYCSGDFVHSRDNRTFLPGPGCRLGPFVPYTRP